MVRRVVGRRCGPPGLRWRATLSFALGALTVSAVLTSSTYWVCRAYLIKQREASALRQAFADASVVRDRLLPPGAVSSDVVADLVPRAGARVLVHVDGQWHSTGLDDVTLDLPPALVRAVGAGRAQIMWGRAEGQAAVVVGVPLPAVSAQFYEVGVVEEFERTLRVLRSVLIGAGVLTALAAALLGRAVARGVVRPLDRVAAAASAIAAGQMDTRLEPTEDPDLVTIVASFNTMVDALSARLEREARFTADVSHELRSPLTTLVAGVGLLSARRNELPARSQQALDLVERELLRFPRTLSDLLELARLDANAEDVGVRRRTDVVELVGQVLVGHGYSRRLIAVGGGGRPVATGDEGGDEAEVAGGTDFQAHLDRCQIERGLSNLVDNAERHGGGLREIVVRRDADWVDVCVDDGGPGVRAGDEGRIFGRFARGTSSRGSTTGTGLGLSLTAETVQRHGGTVWCERSPHGGARFVLRLPRCPRGEDVEGNGLDLVASRVVR